MFKKKLKELHMMNSSRESDQVQKNQIQPTKKVQVLNNERRIENFSKRNLPELKLSKLKSRLSPEADTEPKEEKKTINTRKQKSRSLIKRKEVIFPQISKNRVNEFNNPTQKGGKIHSLYNNSNNNNLNHNNMLNIHKIKPNIPINNKGITKQKNKPNFTKTPDTNSAYHSYPAQLQSNSTKESSKDSNKENELDIDKEKKELDLMAEKLNMLHSLFNSLNSLAGLGVAPPSFDNLFKPKPTVQITADILTQTTKNPSETGVSPLDEFSSGDFLKAYAYNSNQGNVRDYNEDTITARKINDYFFFGVYDGHGGNGCSIYLRDNLYNYITEFSKEGIKKAIEEAEDSFITKKALSPKKELLDPSGSCGIMAIIKENKCIIANVGDSRCVVFKKGKTFFATEDHKPNSDVEKERITKAGGKLYQTPTLFPLFQNGQEVTGPWRVLPGRLSVSRTFGDVEAKEESLGGMKGVVVALPDITEIELDNDTNFIVIGCDGIFDVLSNEDLIECARIVIKERKDYSLNHLCGEIANMIVKAALAKDSFDNVSCIVLVMNLDGI